MSTFTFRKRFLAVVVLTIASAALSSDFEEKTRVARSVSEKPEIYERPQRQRVHVNQSASFVCRVRSKSPVTIKWLKYDRKLRNITGSLLLINDSLMLLHVQKSDEGTYKCVVTNNVGLSSSETTLTVLDPLIAPFITQMSSNLTITEGKRVTFTCKARGNPQPEIKWKREHVAYTQPERPSPGSIRILSATPRDSGKYSCIAVNEKGKDSRVLFLKVLGYPVFLESPPGNITVHENTTVSLNCKVTGFPPPQARWYFRNKQVGTGGKAVVLSNMTLVITPVNFTDSGTYTCVANNSEGLRRSKSTLLRVLRSPRWSCCPDKLGIVKNLTAIDGQSISLDCLAAGHPEPIYDWRFDNATLSQSPVYTISRVSVENKGVYFCRVFNNLGSLGLKIFLTVSVPPKVYVKPEQTIVLSGQSVEFNCTATGDPLPDIIWYFPSGKISQNDSLVIANVSVNNEGEYQCEGKSKAGKSVAKGTLIVAVRPKFVVLPPRNITANEDSSILVRCSANGPNEPVINWYRLATDGKKMNISTNNRISINFQALKISQLKTSDGGFYSCEATNYAGVVNTSFFINIQYRPYLIISSRYTRIVAGMEASLHCPVKANPVPQITWIRPISFVGADLLIVNVNISHEGQYICIAVNKLGTIQATLGVTVLTSPRIVGLKKVEQTNDWVSLTCETKGDPQSAVDWLDQTPLTSGVFSVDRGNLQMEKRFIKKMDFICNASNSYGWVSKHVRVPSSLHKLKVVKITSSTVTLSWAVDSTEIISRVVIERLSKADSTWIAVRNLTLAVSFIYRDLQPFTWFSFRIRAMNVLGTSDPSEILNITTLEGVPSQPTDVTAKSRELTAITIVWKPPKEPRGLLTNILYEVYYMEHGGLPKEGIKISNSTTADLPLEITNLKSNVLYIIKVRAGRKAVDGVVYWSVFELLRTMTLLKAPTMSPENIKVVSNGPRRLFVSWKRADQFVEGYKLRYAEYESSSNVTTVLISSWNRTDYMITGLSSSKYYEIYVNMFTSGGDGPLSVPVVTRTDQDRLSSLSSSDGLPWKIALGGTILVVVLLTLVLAYVYLSRKPKQNSAPDKQEKTKSHKDSYNFDNVSQLSNESEGSIHGIYNVNMENDIDFSMFDDSHHANASGAASSLYVENPILPSHEVESDDSYEAVRLATFTARPSPMPTPGGSPDDTTRRHLVSREIDSDFTFPDPPVYTEVDSAAKTKERHPARDTLEQLTDDILI